MKTADETIQHPGRWLGVTVLVVIATLAVLFIIGLAVQHSGSAPSVPSCPSGTYWNTYYQSCAP